MSIKEYEKEVTWLKQNLQREMKDEVWEKLNKDVIGVSAIKDLILDFGNKALQDEHMNIIFALLSEGNTYSPSRTFTLAELINDGVFEVNNKFGEISSIASGEYAISQILEEIKKIWASMDLLLPTIEILKIIYPQYNWKNYDQTRRSLSIISNNERIQECARY